MKNLAPQSKSPVNEEELISASIKPYSKKELQILYEVSDRSFSKWLKALSGQIGKRNGRYYNLLQVQIIFSNFGVPLIRR